MKHDSDQLIEIFRQTVCAGVRADSPDLSARQLAVLLVVGLEDGFHTVRGLSMQLKISKPALSRSLDRLVDLGLAVRGPDVRDRRSVLVHLTDEGMRYLSQLRKMLLEAAHPALPRKMARRAVGLHHPQMHAA